MKGIILAGGNGTRLLPLTSAVTKQVLPVYNKPMIYYPLATLMNLGITEIAIITTPQHQYQIRKLFGDGTNLGIDITYFMQAKAEGLAQAFVICEDWLEEEPCVLILGDNIFTHKIKIDAIEDDKSSACCLLTEVANPQRYGVYDYENKVLVEKPEIPPSNFACVGIYYVDGTAAVRARMLKPSKRGELEITDLLNSYAVQDNLKVEYVQSGSWFDAGTFDSLLEVSQYIKSSEQRTGISIGDPFSINSTF